MITHRSKIYTKNILCRIILILGDMLSLALSFYIAYNLKVMFFHAGWLPMPTPEIEFYFQFGYLLLFYIFFLYFYKIYNIRPSFWQELKKILKAITISTVFVFFILALLKISQEVSRFIIITMALSSFILIPSIKALIKFILYKSGIWHANSIIIANKDNQYSAFLKKIQNNWYVGYRPSYVIELDSAEDYTNLKRLTKRRLEEIIKAHNIVLPILYKIDKNKFFDVFIKLDIYFDNIKLIPDLHSLFVNNINVESDGDNLLINFNNNLLKFNNRIIQYLFNKVASVVIAVLIFPILLIVTILIKLDSRGPAFYKAKRIGYNEKVFYVYKFRTMFNDADKKLNDLLESSEELKNEFEENFKLKRDPRVTRIGRFLRKTSLDELPQIFNVFKGEMNLVGPRPIVNDEIEKYGEAFYELIKVKPGVSGLWQVSGRSDVGYDERVQLDLFYIKNWSLWMDIIILIKTLFVVIQGRGAY